MLARGKQPAPIPLPDLGHCPFCGHQTPPSAYDSPLFGFPQIVCVNRRCGCSMHGDALNRDVVAMWLRRQPPQQGNPMTKPDQLYLIQKIAAVVERNSDTVLDSVDATDKVLETLRIVLRFANVMAEMKNEVSLQQRLARLLPNINTTPMEEVVAQVIALVRENDAQVVHATQDPKYSIRNNRLINAERNEDIPLDEPGFWIRARDLHGEAGVHGYAMIVGRAAADGDVPVAHLHAVRRRVEDFAEFRKNHPERMKQPDTDPPKGQETKLQNSGYSGTFGERNPKVVQQGDVRFRQQSEGPSLTDEQMPD